MLIQKTELRLAVSRLALTLGLGQTIAWASSYYLPAVLASHMADALGCPVSTVYAAFSAALITAALTLPFAGRCADTWGGKRVLVASNLWCALSLVVLSQTQNEVGLFLGWILLGVAMGAGLYDIAFATVVQSCGPAAQPVIIGMTLLGGFSSTVGWPISHALLTHLDWRQVLMVWAGVHLFLGLPLHLSLNLPRWQGGKHLLKTETDSPREPEKSKVPAMVVIALAFVFLSFSSAAMAAHLPGLMQMCGVSVAASILVGATFGPAQVAGRLLHLFVLQRFKPITTTILAILIMPLGAVALALLGPVAGVALFVGVAHGFGNGIISIVKGALPLCIFGEKRFGRRQGLLFFPAGIALAISPFLFSVCIDAWGKDALYVYIAAIWMSGLLFFCLKRLTGQDQA